jgi:hypothetical protein
MIIGKNSALKGFALFFIFVIAIITSIFAFCYASYITSGKALVIIVPILNILIVGYFCYKKYMEFSKN